MKRFIDIRGQGTGMRFAWYDTVLDRFECHSGEYAWDTWEEFAHDCEGRDISRYLSLCPEWAFIEKDDQPNLYIKLRKASARAAIANNKMRNNVR